MENINNKPKTRKNTKLIKILDIRDYGRNHELYCNDNLLLRTARRPGDIERVNHTVLGRLNRAGVKYEIIEENINNKKKIRLTESKLKQIVSETIKRIIKEKFDNVPEILNMDPSLLNTDELKYCCKFLAANADEYIFSNQNQKRFDEFYEELQKRSKINESVKNVLTELDWKTYANAARKDKDQNRAKKFREKAAENFNQDFGYNGDDEFARTKMSNDTLSLGHRYKKDDDSQVFFSTHLDPSYENTPTNYGEVEPYGSKTHGYVKKPFTNSKTHARAMQKSQDAFNAYRTGKSKYVKGTGWDDSEHTPTDWHEYMDYNN